jgi:hypothetical protein
MLNESSSQFRFIVFPIHEWPKMSGPIATLILIDLSVFAQIWIWGAWYLGEFSAMAPNSKRRWHPLGQAEAHQYPKRARVLLILLFFFFSLLAVGGSFCSILFSLVQAQ